MNFPVWKLEPLEADENLVTDVLRPIVHSILFNRLIIDIRPIEIESKTFDVVYPAISDDSLNEQVESQLRKVLETIVKDKKGLVQVSFSTSQVTPGFLYSTEKKIIWEQWVIPIILTRRGTAGGGLREKDKREKYKLLSKEIKKRLFSVLKYADEKEDHIPRELTSFGIECAANSHSDWSAFGKLFTEFRFLS